MFLANPRRFLKKSCKRRLQKKSFTLDFQECKVTSRYGFNFQKC